jgi:hypothetical protein
MTDPTSPTRPRAEEIRALLAVLAAHPWLSSAEMTMVDGTYINGGRYSFDYGVNVHLSGAAVPGIGEHDSDHDPADGRDPFATFKTEIDGVTVTTYATRR